MKARSKLLCEHSVGMAVSAIEIYNKPDFKQREQVFTILMVAAWEALLKAKILKDAKNKPQALWVAVSRPRRAAPKEEPKTISLNQAIDRLALPDKVVANIRALADIRNAAVHLTAETKALPQLVFQLGAATLQNYAKLASTWFGVSLANFSFFILPLGFRYPFRQFTVAESRKEPETIAAILAAISSDQNRFGRESDGFELVCEVSMTLTSAKKLTDAPDLVAVVGDAGDGIPTATRVVNPLDRYPFSYRDLERRIKDRVPGVTQNDVQRVIRSLRLKGDLRYSYYNYRYKTLEAKGPNKNTPVIYNAEAVKLVVATLAADLAARRQEADPRP